MADEITKRGKLPPDPVDFGKKTWQQPAIPVEQAQANLAQLGEAAPFDYDEDEYTDMSGDAARLQAATDALAAGDQLRDMQLTYGRRMDRNSPEYQQWLNQRREHLAREQARRGE